MTHQAQAQILDLARATLQHLQREEQLLDQLNVVADQLSQELRSKNREETSNSVLPANDTAEAIREVADARYQIRSRIAKCMGVPIERTTMSLVAQYCDIETATAIRHHCQVLQSKAMKLNTVSTANGLLVFRLARLLDTIFCTLSGEPHSPQLYNRDGYRNAA